MVGVEYGDPFLTWCEDTLPFDYAKDPNVRKAWDAGVAWARSQGGPAGNASNGEGSTERPLPPSTNPLDRLTYNMALIDRHGPSDQDWEPLDDRVQQTLLAALAAYRDNYLAYGGIPGQLSAQEVTELITKLTPKEGQ